MLCEALLLNISALSQELQDHFIGFELFSCVYLTNLTLAVHHGCAVFVVIGPRMYLYLSPHVTVEIYHFQVKQIFTMSVESFGTD